MSTLLQDLRYGARLLLKTPGFTLIAALSLALGIGANTTIFTLINAVLLNPLPVEDPSQLVSVWTTDELNRSGGFGFGFLQTSPMNYKDLRDKNEVFSGIAAHAGLPLNITGGTGDPQQVFGEIVTGNYFSVLGAKPAIGRGFLPDEDQKPGAKLVCVLGYGEWQKRFGGEPSIVGRTISLNGRQFTVVGVMPKGFKGTNAIGAPAVWVPYMTYQQTTTGFFLELIRPDQRRGLVFNVTGRLKPGVSVRQAEANLKTLARQLEQEYPNDNKGRNVTLVPLAQATINPGFRGNIVAAGGLLMTIVALVLLIACANVANLLLARAAARQKEIAVRLSLGATRAQLIRQLLTEGTLLAVVGGAAGLMLAYWAQDVLWSFRPPFLQADAIDIHPDARVLLFTLGIALATGVLFGLAPAIQASRPDLVVELKEKTSAPTGSRSPLSLRNVLVAAQIALSLIALIGAGLFLRSLQNAQRINPGFDVERLATMSFDLGAQGYTEERGRQFQQRVLERAASVPGVQSATLASTVPLFAGGFARTVFLEGQDASDRRAGRLVQIAVASSHYLETLGIALVRGRPTSEIDQPNTPSAVVINETMAKRFWPDQDAIGKRFKFFGQDNFQQVVGIARDSKYNFIGEDPTPYIYQATTQVYQPQLSLFVKAPNPQAVIGTVRGEVQQLDRNLPLTGVFTLNEIFDQSLWAPRMGAWLLAVFAGLSLVLAVIGIYGVMAYSVSQRTRELGIRMALGAGRADVVRLVVLQGLRLTIAGVIVGLAVSLAVTRLVATLLFNVSPTDLVTFVAVPALLAVAALGASYLPALRATRIDPMIALRYE
ncbi:MAG: permease [Acidobacteria bacterium]|nr:MAG: permease [Acidobacteriota bacterium]PYQ89572.1 MAG: permease [Acidobacteriota bacterium]PYR06383.1 MAG: permease [Acidobacteriota bacterium]